MRRWFEREVRRVACPAGEDSHRARCAIDLPDRRASLFYIEPVFGDVTVRSNADVELGSVRTGGEGLRPMVVDWTCRQVRNLETLPRDARRAGRVWESEQGIGAGHVKRVANQHHAVR